MTITKTNADAIQALLQQIIDSLNEKIKEAESYKKEALEERRDNLAIRVLEVEGHAEFNEVSLAANRAIIGEREAMERAERARLLVLEEQVESERVRRDAMERQAEAFQRMATSLETLATKLGGGQ